MSSLLYSTLKKNLPGDGRPSQSQETCLPNGVTQAGSWSNWLPAQLLFHQAAAQTLPPTCTAVYSKRARTVVSSVQQSQEHTQAPSCEHATCCLRSSFHICKSSPKYTKSATGSATTLLPRCTCTPADFSVGLHHLVTPSLHQRHRGCHQQPKGTSQHRRTPKLPSATVCARKPVRIRTLRLPVGLLGVLVVTLG